MNSGTQPKITLEQWLAFVAVVDEGSFARAAERLHKSQSAVSYAIARLNEQLPTPALTLEGRRAALTPAGEVLYRHAEELIRRAQATEQAASYLAGGVETELVLVVDGIASMTPVLCALDALAKIFPATRVRILETSLSGTDEAVLGQACDVAVMVRVPPGFLGRPLPPVTMVACAGRHHPLARLGQVTESDLRGARQIVVADSGQRREQNAGWLGAEQRWTVSHFGISVDIVARGLGFAFLPTHRLAGAWSDLILRLPMSVGGVREIALSLVLTRPEHAGPAARALAAELERCFFEPAASR